MEKKGNPLKGVKYFNKKYRVMLEQLWITTVEDVAGLISLYENNSRITKNMILALFARELQVSINTVDREIITKVKKYLSRTQWKTIAEGDKPLSFGLLDNEINVFGNLGGGFYYKKKANNFPGHMDLFQKYPERFNDVQDQNVRQTCVAFSVTALHEYVHAKIRGGRPPYLSQEFLYWASRKIQYKLSPHECYRCGTGIQYAITAILELGQCLAKTKPYINKLPCNLKFADDDEAAPVFCCYRCECSGKESYLATGSLSPAVKNEALSYRLKDWFMIKLTDIENIKCILHKGLPVVLGIKCYLSMLSPVCCSSGIITLPFQLEIADNQYNMGAHSMLITGYYNDCSVPGGGYFIIRNSWGKSWGKSPGFNYSPGNGIIPYAYLNRHNFCAYTLCKKE